MQLNDVITNGKFTWKITKLVTDSAGNILNVNLDEIITREQFETAMGRLKITPDPANGTEAMIVTRATNDWSGRNIVNTYMTKNEHDTKTKHAIDICNTLYDNVSNFAIDPRSRNTNIPEMINEAQNYDNICLKLLNDTSWFDNTLASKYTRFACQYRINEEDYTNSAYRNLGKTPAVWLKGNKYVAILYIGDAKDNAAYSSIILKFYNAHTKYKGMMFATHGYFFNNVSKGRGNQENNGSFASAYYALKEGSTYSTTLYFNKTHGFNMKSMYTNRWNSTTKSLEFTKKSGEIITVRKLFPIALGTYIKYSLTVSLKSTNGYGAVFLSHKPLTKNAFFDDNGNFLYPEEGTVVGGGARILWSRYRDNSNSKSTITFETKDPSSETYIGLVFYKAQEDSADLLNEGLQVWDASMSYHDIENGATINLPDGEKTYFSQYGTSTNIWAPVGEFIKQFVLRTETATTTAIGSLGKINDNLIAVFTYTSAETTDSARSIAHYYINATGVPTAGGSVNSEAANTTANLYLRYYVPSLYDDYVMSTLYVTSTLTTKPYIQETKAAASLITYLVNPLNGTWSNINPADSEGNRPAISIGTEYYDYVNANYDLVDNTTNKAYVTWSIWNREKEYTWYISKNKIRITQDDSRRFIYPFFDVCSGTAAYKETYYLWRCPGIYRAVPIRILVGYNEEHGGVIPKTLDEYDISNTGSTHNINVGYNSYKRLVNVVEVENIRYIICLKNTINLSSGNTLADIDWDYRDDWYNYYFDVLYLDPQSKYFYKSDLSVLDLAKAKYTSNNTGQ